MAELSDKELFVVRTLERDASVWHNWDAGGSALEMLSIENLYNQLYTKNIQAYMDIADSEYSDEVTNRDKLHELSMLEVDTDRQIAQDKYATRVAALALGLAGDKLIAAAQEYDALVQSIIMTAKEYAAAVERRDLLLERDKAEMAVDKAEADLAITQANIIMEDYNRQQGLVDIARSKVEAARSLVRAQMAEIEAEEADIRAIKAQVDAKMMEAEKATLQADVASILADIVTKGLAKIRLEVERAEIEAGYRFIDSFYDDTLEKIQNDELLELYKESVEKLIGVSINELLEAEKAQENLKTFNYETDAAMWILEAAQLTDLQNQEIPLRDELFEARKALAAKEHNMKIDLSEQQTWAHLLLNAARRWTYLNAERMIQRTDYLTQIIHHGIASSGVRGHTEIPDGMCS